jgi:hypothetical protein
MAGRGPSSAENRISCPSAGILRGVRPGLTPARSAGVGSRQQQLPPYAAQD